MELKGEKIDTIQNTKLLGTIISDDLRWDLNTANIVRKSNDRLELLRRVASFSPTLEAFWNNLPQYGIQVLQKKTAMT